MCFGLLSQSGMGEVEGATVAVAQFSALFSVTADLLGAWKFQY